MCIIRIEEGLKSIAVCGEAKTNYLKLLSYQFSMETKVIKVSKENYEWLLSVAAKIQHREKKAATFDDALNSIRRQKISDLAGSWKMSEKEADKLIKDIRSGWSSWNKRFV